MRTESESYQSPEERTIDTLRRLGQIGDEKNAAIESVPEQSELEKSVVYLAFYLDHLVPEGSPNTQKTREARLVLQKYGFLLAYVDDIPKVSFLNRLADIETEMQAFIALYGAAADRDKPAAS
ncbi:MAG: hypothetical protein QG639_751 [Patescibacteria group bacterium]|nr:hypothetical protein [Patescibacteria group bacterium]